MNDKKLKNARIPKQYWGITLDIYKRKTPSTDEFTMVEDYMEYLADHRSEGFGLLLVGKPGTGKSLLACIVLQRAIDEGFSGLFLTMPELVRTHHQIRDLKDAWQKMKDEVAYESWLEKTAAIEVVRNEIDFLVLDDVGKEHTTDSGYTQALFDEIFRHRYNLGLPTIVTTNVLVSKWEGRYSDAMVDFLGEACMEIGFRGKSHRQRGDDGER